MITSSNFFPKNMFNVEDQIERDSNELGPWLISKQRKFATLDISKRAHNKSENRYHNKKYSQPPYSLPKAQISMASYSAKFQNQKHQSDLSQNNIRFRQRSKHQSFLPEISNSKNRKMRKFQLIQSRQSYSPLAFQLNFITKKQQRKNRQLKYIPDYTPQQKNYSLDPIEKYLFRNSSKYNIYEKCVVQIKRNSSRSKQL